MNGKQNNSKYNWVSLDFVNISLTNCRKRTVKANYT